MNLQNIKNGYQACGSLTALLSLAPPAWVFVALMITAPNPGTALIFLAGAAPLGLVAWMYLADINRHADSAETSGRCIPRTRHRLSWTNIRDGAYLLNATDHPASGLGYMAVYVLLAVAALAFPYAPFATTPAHYATIPVAALSLLYVAVAAKEANRVGALAEMSTLVLDAPDNNEGNTL